MLGVKRRDEQRSTGSHSALIFAGFRSVNGVLQTDTRHGLSEEEEGARRNKYGKNEFVAEKSPTLPSPTVNPENLN